MCQGAKVNLFCTSTLPRVKDFSPPFFSILFIAFCWTANARKMRNCNRRGIIGKKDIFILFI